MFHPVVYVSVVSTAPSVATSRRVKKPVLFAAPWPSLWHDSPQLTCSQPSAAACVESPGIVSADVGGLESTPASSSAGSAKPLAEGEARLSASKPRTPSIRPSWQVLHIPWFGIS